MTDKSGNEINVGDYFLKDGEEFIVLRREQDGVLLARSYTTKAELSSFNSEDIELIPDSPE